MERIDAILNAENPITDGEKGIEIPEMKEGIEYKNLTFSYTLPSKYVKNSNVLKGAKVYLTGRNLWTVKDKSFKGTDPEVDSNLTMGRVVNSRQIQVGVEVTF